MSYCPLLYVDPVLLRSSRLDTGHTSGLKLPVQSQAPKSTCWRVFERPPEPKVRHQWRCHSEWAIIITESRVARRLSQHELLKKKKEERSVAAMNLSWRCRWHRPEIGLSNSADKAEAERFIASSCSQTWCHIYVLFYLCWFDGTNSRLSSRESGHCPWLEVWIWHGDICVCYSRLISLVSISGARAKGENCDPNAHFKTKWLKRWCLRCYECKTVSGRWTDNLLSA